MSYYKEKTKKERKSGKKKKLRQNMIFFYSLEIIYLILRDLMRNLYKIGIKQSKRCMKHLEKNVLCSRIRCMEIGRSLYINTTLKSQMVKKTSSVKMHCVYLKIQNNSNLKVSRSSFIIIFSWYLYYTSGILRYNLRNLTKTYNSSRGFP
jgi:hypothetical protein